jgi:hypothetical protein
MVRRILIGGSGALFAAGLFAPGMAAAKTHPKVRPHQYFAGLVNRSLGTPKSAVIKVLCPGPEALSGHPLSGQTVDVGLSIRTASNSGYTGDGGTSIGAFFGPLPPGTGGPGQWSMPTSQ